MIKVDTAPKLEIQQATILLVEDDIAILEGVADLLEFSAEQFEITVLKAENGVEALTLFEQHIPDLVISDIAMPLMDGYSFLTKVRANPNWAHIPFILLTAQASNRQISKGLAQGVELYLTKPFNSFELIELAETQLNKSLQQRQVRQSRESQMRRDLSRTLQHELRTPLALVTAYLEFLDMGVDSGFSNTPVEFAELQEYLRGIDIGVQRLARLVDDIVAALDLRSGHTMAHIRAESHFLGDIKALIYSAAATVQALDDHDHATIKFEFPTALGFLYGQPAYLENAIARVIDNAFKFTKFKGQGEITIRVTVLDRDSAENSVGYLQPGSDGTLQIDIVDNGIGFPHHVRWQLTELFYQYNREEWEQQGSGIGLTLVKGICEAHNGRIKLRSVPNKGSTISIFLPHYQTQTEAPELGIAPPPKRSATVLLVDDNSTVREIFVELVELMETAFHFDILLAEDGQQGLDVLDTVIPDLIVSDVRMPNMDGLQMLAAIRQNPTLAEIPVIFLTANRHPEQIHAGRKLGVDEYIAKPYNPQHLIDRMETLLKRHFEKQAAEANNFDVLKERVLASVEVGIVDTLNDLAQQSETMRQLVTNHTSVTESTDIGMLRQSLVGLQHNSSQISGMVRNATTLVEIRTGAAEATFKSRAGLIENLADIVGAAVRDFRATYLSVAVQPDQKYQIEFEQVGIAKPIFGNAKMLSTAFTHLLHLLVGKQANTGHLKITVDSIGGVPTVSAECTASQPCKLHLNAIRQLNDNDQTININTADTIIFCEYMRLHSAEIKTIESKGSIRLSIQFQPFDMALYA